MKPLRQPARAPSGIAPNHERRVRPLPPPGQRANRKHVMEIWSHDAFASAIAYAVIAEVDALLAAHPAGAGLRTALRTIVRLPCVGYDYDAETGAPTPTTEEPVSLSATRAALAWLADLVTTAIHQPLTDETERKAV